MGIVLSHLFVVILAIENEYRGQSVKIQKNRIFYCGIYHHPK